MASLPRKKIILHTWWNKQTTTKCAVYDKHVHNDECGKKITKWKTNVQISGEIETKVQNQPSDNVAIGTLKNVFEIYAIRLNVFAQQE